ncbi:MAG: serine hydrolase [Chryseolinea sp.]
MIRTKEISFILFFIFCAFLTFGQNALETQIDSIAKKIEGNVGVSALILETNESASYNGDKKFPMQSVYKFPIAMAVLHQVDEGKFTVKKNTNRRN